MAMKTDNPREDIVRQVRAVGESIIKNAESIVGTELYLSGLTIKAEVSCWGSEIPEISISRSFTPEKIVEEA